MKAEDGEFGVKATAVFAAALGGAGRRGAIKGGDPQNEPAQQADTTGACFATAQRSVGLLYFFWAASAQAG